MSRNWTSDQFREYAQRRLASEQRARTEIQRDGLKPISETFMQIAESAIKGDVKSDVKTDENDSVVGAVSNPKRKRFNLSALVKGASRSRKGQQCLVARVLIISVRHKALDGDNLQAGAKWIRDNIARQLGCDDAEGAGIEWSYGQVISRGEQGTIVRIEAV